MRTVLVLMIVAMLTISCAQKKIPTPYEESYKDTHIRDNIYYLQVSTNSVTEQIVAVQYFHRRAKELCLEQGYFDYRINNEVDATKKSNYVSASPGVAMASSSNMPGFAGYVECLKRKK
jgi:hypothetical protein